MNNNNAQQGSLFGVIVPPVYLYVYFQFVVGSVGASVVGFILPGLIQYYTNRVEFNTAYTEEVLPLITLLQSCLCLNNMHYASISTGTNIVTTDTLNTIHQMHTNTGETEENLPHWYIDEDHLPAPSNTTTTNLSLYNKCCLAVTLFIRCVVAFHQFYFALFSIIFGTVLIIFGVYTVLFTKQSD